MSSTDAEAKRALRDRPLGKVLAVLVVLFVAVVVARSCGSSHGEISQEEAIEIAREEISYEPDEIQVRNVAQGVPKQRRIWAVSLYVGDRTAPEKVTVVEIDAETGEVTEVHGPRS
jgi:Peptidase propeptide and YPEB domain